MIIKLTNKLDSDGWHLDWSETSFFKNKKKERKTGNQINYGLCAHLYELKGAMRRNSLPRLNSIQQRGTVM